MKIFIFKRSHIILSAAVLIFAVFSLSAMFTSVETSSQTKELPIYSVERNDKKIAVTFDSAWGDEDIDEIIAALSEASCPATFFVTGEWAEKYPESLKKLYDAGHEIASHSYNHTLYSSFTREEIKADMDKCDTAIKNAIGISPTLVRAPSGDYTNDFVLAAKETNRYPIQWDVDSLDWKELDENAMKERIFDRVASGSILLFHTGTEQTAAALPGILSALSAEGDEFVTVSDLIYKDNYYLD
ncbi:MAG: polysaccharide deacetylase family protein, partial [Clostridia bacterium]|nr:polysaccharide deacetylase family protein [Clostridia bacterium]